MISTMNGVMTIFLIMALGYVLTIKGWFTEETGKLFSRIVTKISLPAFMVSNLTANFTKDTFYKSYIVIILALGTMIICYGIGILVSKLIKLPKNKRGIFGVMFGLSNSIFIGLPMNNAIFGPESTQYVLLFYIANTLFFWTIGVYGIKRDSEVINRIFSLEGLKNIITPPIVAFLITITTIMLNINIPKFILDSCTYIGNLTTPLSILFVGITLTSLDLKNIKLNKQILLVCLGRFLIAPMIMFMMISKTSMPLLMKKVFILEAAMPVMTQAAIVIKAYGGDYEEATIFFVVTTAISLIVMPLYMIMFNFMK